MVPLNVLVDGRKTTIPTQEVNFKDGENEIKLG